MAFACVNRKGLTLLTSTALLLGFLTSPLPTVAHAAEKPGDTLIWAPCPKDAAKRSSRWNMQCSTFKVPLDYKNPTGKKITIMMSRIKATGRARGVILNNPGGPGGSGLNLWSWMLRTGSAIPLHHNFDLIAVQPRGLEHATPLRHCVNPDIADNNKNTKDKDLGTITKTINDITDRSHNLRKKITSKTSDVASKEYQKCVKDYKELFEHVTTENTARDFDMARQYLGQHTINFYGASYGTWLGAVYATLFPQHIDRLVLDSAVDPTGIWMDNFGSQGDMQRRRMYEMFDFFAARDNLYHLGDTPLKVYTKWYRIIGREMQGPTTPRIGAPPAQIGDVPPQFKRNIQLYLTGYNLARPLVDRIERALHAWEAPNEKNEHNLWEITGLAFTSRTYWSQVAAYMQNPQPKPLTKEEKEEKSVSDNVFRAVTCNENATVPKPLNLPATGIAYFMGADIFTLKNLIASSGIMCLGTRPNTKPINVTGAFLKNRPVVLQSIYDTQTPYAGGQKMAHAMNAYFVKADGGDHGVYVYDNPEAWELVNNYYLRKPIVTRTKLPYARVDEH